VAAEPTVDIGVLDGAPEYQLFRVRAALTLSDGRIVVSNSGTQQLRLYDPQGRYLLTAGGPGEGPGEFARLGQAAVLPGDSVAGYDWRSRRVSLFGPDGQYGRSWRIEIEARSGFPQVRTLMADGSVLAQIIEYRDDDTDGWQRDTAQIVIFDPAGVPADTLGRFPDREVLTRTTEMDGGGVMSFIRDTPFSRGLLLTASGDKIYAADTGTYEIRLMDRDGRLRRIIRRVWENAVVTDADIQILLDEELADAEDDNERRRIRQDYAEMTPHLHDTAPAFSTLFIDLEGNLWIRGYAMPGEPAAPWTVFDAQGAMLGDVETPEGVRVMEIGSDYILGRWRDELDVEHVRRYPLLKN
jgi:hypothetical protein